MKKITNNQIQKLQDLLERSQLRFESITNNRPLRELTGNKYAMANYWDGKKVALGEVLHILKI